MSRLAGADILDNSQVVVESKEKQQAVVALEASNMAGMDSSRGRFVVAGEEPDPLEAFQVAWPEGHFAVVGTVHQASSGSSSVLSLVQLLLGPGSHGEYGPADHNSSKFP